MIRQTILPFKIEKTRDTITAHGGLALFGDEGLREILPLKRIPSADAIGDWLRSKGVDGGLDLLEKVEQILMETLSNSRKDCISFKSDIFKGAQTV